MFRELRELVVLALLVMMVMPIVAGRAQAQDIAGIQEHALVSRYPGQEIRWQHIENYMPFRIPAGKATGYRQIDKWIDTAGLVTRTFYRYKGADRTYSEFYLNYLEALKGQGFELLTQGISPDRKGAEAGSRKWSAAYFAANATTKPGEVGTFYAGTSSSGGAGTIVAKKERAAGTVYVVIGIEQHSSNYVGTLIDIVEVAEAETGLVAVDAEAIGSGIADFGRVVLDGLVFDFDKATLKPESDSVLKAIVEYLNANAAKKFYVVGHTDSVGTFAYNRKLSSDRALAVASALKTRFGVASDRLESHGVGPLVPVFSNSQDAGKAKNRRVELVER